MELCRLDQLKEGESAGVVKLYCLGSIRRRLQDMGLVSGSRVTSLGRSPLGDPAAYRVRGAVIALRRDDARAVTVQPIE